MRDRPVSRALVRRAARKLEVEAQLPGPRDLKRDQIITDAYNLLLEALDR